MANLIIKPTSGGSLILQDEGGTAANTIDASGNTQLAGTLGVTGNATFSGTANNLGTVTAGTFEGTLNSSTTFSGDAGQKTAKAWLTVDNAGGSTNTIRNSFNIASVGDTSTGRLQINFTNNMANIYYCIAMGALNNTGSNSTHVWGGAVSPTVGGFELRHGINMSNSLAHGYLQYIIVFGD